MRVMGLVAAAGASRRMGSPKALLPWGFDDDGSHVGDRFVTHLVAAMLGGGVDTVTVTAALICIRCVPGHLVLQTRACANAHGFEPAQ